ncbi:MAG: hypothetical protein ABSE43_05200 [Steroidobacteraceae bacterium]|jgi:hypothetical protein
MPSPLPVPSANAGVSDLLGAAGRLFRLALPKCLPFAMIASLLGQAPALMLQVHGQPLKLFELPTDPYFWVEYGIAIVCDMLLFTLVVLRMRSLMRGVQPDLREELPRLLVRLPLLMPALLLALVAYTLGIALLVAPGIYIIVCLSVLPAVVMFEDHTVIGSLKRSIVLMSRHWVKNFAVYVIGFLIGCACVAFAAGLVGIALESAAGNNVTLAIEQALVIAFSGVMWTFLSAITLILYTSASSSA